MKRIGKLTVLILIAVSMIALPMVAAPPSGLLKREHKGVAQHLYLYEKVPTEDWPIVEDGAWGHLIYHESGKFVFNGHELEAEVDYSLIYYPDPWPGNGLQELGSATSDADGNVHILGKDFGFAGIPTDEDENEGAKIWLVLSDDVDLFNHKMVGWTPTEYLFEHNQINIS